MAQTIQLEGMTVTAILAFWGPDYYTKQQGWHLRVSFQDADDEDDNNCPISEMPCDTTDAKIVENVAAWLYDLDGMAPEDAQAVRNMIEVKR